MPLAALNLERSLEKLLLYAGRLGIDHQGKFLQVHKEVPKKELEISDGLGLYSGCHVWGRAFFVAGNLFPFFYADVFTIPIRQVKTLAMTSVNKILPPYTTTTVAAKDLPRLDHRCMIRSRLTRFPEELLLYLLAICADSFSSCREPVSKLIR